MLRKEFYGVGQMKGYLFTRIYKDNKFYIYEVKSVSGSVKYEVFKRRRLVRNGELKEVYPSSEDFGTQAWCCVTLADAYKKINNY